MKYGYSTRLHCICDCILEGSGWFWWVVLMLNKCLFTEKKLKPQEGTPGTLSLSQCCNTDYGKGNILIYNWWLVELPMWFIISYTDHIRTVPTYMVVWAEHLKTQNMWKTSNFNKGGDNRCWPYWIYYMVAIFHYYWLPLATIPSEAKIGNLKSGAYFEI